MAVLKYRLYAIDRIISRTVSDVLVTGLVVGVYLGCVALLTRVLPVRGSVGVAVSVLAAAALFTPLRLRVQSLVDQRFDRARYNAERVVTQFSVSCATRSTSTCSVRICAAWSTRSWPRAPVAVAV